MTALRSALRAAAFVLIIPPLACMAAIAAVASVAWELWEAIQDDADAGKARR